MRENTVRGPAIDLGEFERRLRGPEKIRHDDDPLSELARLMDGYEAAAAADPYGRILSEPEAAARAPAVELRGSYAAAPLAAEEAVQYDPAHYHEPAFDAAPEPAYPDERDYYQAQPDYAQPHVEAPPYDAAYHGGAEGGWSDDSQYLDYGQSDEDYEQIEPRRFGGWLRPWHAVVAISLLAVASIGFAFWHRSGSDASREIATIVAPEGPVKVRPTTEAETSAPDAGTAVLDRKEPAPVKQVVANQEQAVDPTVSPKVVQLGNGPVNAPHEGAPLASAAQPRRVKTVTVRPDGSPVEDAALPPAVAKATRPAPEAEPIPAATNGGTPASAAKPATTPKPAAKVKPPAPTKVAAVEEPPADGAEEAAAPASKGGFAVQFGAAGSEAEARTLMKTVVAKYGAQLGGLKPTFKMATVGEKTVYRVRVGGVAKESATAICTKVKAAGGACFVAGN